MPCSSNCRSVAVTTERSRSPSTRSALPDRRPKSSSTSSATPPTPDSRPSRHPARSSRSAQAASTRRQRWLRSHDASLPAVVHTSTGRKSSVAAELGTCTVPKPAVGTLPRHRADGARAPRASSQSSAVVARLRSDRGQSQSGFGLARRVRRHSLVTTSRLRWRRVGLDGLVTVTAFVPYTVGTGRR